MENQLITAVVLVLLLLALAIFWNRLSRFLHRSERKPPYPIRRLDGNAREIAVLRKLPPSPITRISFQEAMSSGRLGSEIKQYGRETLSAILTGDSINITAELLSRNKRTFQYEFSREATKLYEAGQASIPVHAESGKALPFMHDRSGRIIEHAKGVSRFGLMLAQAGELIVMAANAISAWDIVKRQKELDRKLSGLVAGKRIEQDSKFNRIYTRARGILRCEIDAAAVRNLETSRYELYELRTEWCGELSERVLSANVLPDLSWWHHSSWFRRGNREKEFVASLVPIAEKLQRLPVALLTDWYLSVASGTTEDFRENAVPSEQDLWAPVSAKMGQLTAGFRKQATAAQLEIICAGVNSYLDLLKALAGQELSSTDCQDAIPGPPIHGVGEPETDS